MSTLQKARIYDPAKPQEAFHVQFNPNSLEYSVSSSSRTNKKVKAIPADSAAQEPQLQGDPTGRLNAASLSVKLFYHTYQNETTFTDVRLEVNRIRAFLRRTGTGGEIISPKMAFAWGTLTQIGTLESFQVHFQMFAADGTPVQAEVSLSIQGDDPDVTAASNDQAAKAAYESDVNADWRQSGRLPDGTAWLFQ